MIRKLSAALLTAAVLSAAAATQVKAAFTYDLRLAPGQSGAVDAHNVAINASTPTTYTLQLWGQISGDTNLTNDGYVVGFLGLTTAQGSGGAFTSGGVTSATLGYLHESVQGSTIGTGGTDLNGDGITDWGSTTTTFVTGNEAKFLRWGGLITPGTPDGTPVTDLSEQVDANTWEVLIATFTVNVGSQGTAGGTTTFNVFSPTAFADNSLGQTTSGLIYTQDSANVNRGTAINDTSVVFTVPEPTSLTLLALGSLALVNRRRKV